MKTRLKWPRPSESGHLRPAPGGVKDAPEAARRLFAHGKPATCAHPYPQPNLPMRALLDVILIALNIYMWIVIAAVILSWLVAFNVVNTRHPFVAAVADFLYRITEPVLRPIRNLMPNLGGIDISPIILFLIIILIERVIIYYIYPNVI
jgi:YggT family protein